MEMQMAKGSEEYIEEQSWNGQLIPPKTYYKATIIKSVWYQNTYTKTDQQTDRVQKLNTPEQCQTFQNAMKEYSSL